MKHSSIVLFVFLISNISFSQTYKNKKGELQENKNLLIYVKNYKAILLMQITEQRAQAPNDTTSLPY
jgi:hypothetical protein